MKDTLDNIIRAEMEGSIAKFCAWLPVSSTLYIISVSPASK